MVMHILHYGRQSVDDLICWCCCLWQSSPSRHQILAHLSPTLVGNNMGRAPVHTLMFRTPMSDVAVATTVVFVAIVVGVEDLLVVAVWWQHVRRKENVGGAHKLVTTGAVHVPSTGRAFQKKTS